MTGPATNNSTLQRAQRLAIVSRGWPWLLLAATLAWSAWLRIACIVARGQYPMYGDEEFITKPAWHMVRDGTLEPGFYRYGSLPLYLVAAAMKCSAGLQQYTGRLAELADVRSVGFPYYSPAGIVLPARVLFALVSVLGMAACAVVARAYARNALMWLAPIALCASTWYLRQSWSYLNVDIVATCLATLGAAWLAHTHARHSHLARVYLPALLCGAAAATKYNNAVLLVPFSLACVQRRALGRSATQLGLLALCTVGVFLVLEPYSLLDFSRFRADVQFELNHYRGGHSGHESDAGWAQLSFYVGELYADFGAALMALGAIGVVYGLVTRPRLTGLVLSYPVALLGLMCSYRVHFTRAILPLFPVCAVWMALGFVVALDAVTWRWSARAPRGVTWLVAAALAAILVCVSPLQQLHSRSRIVTDSRIQTTAWLAAHIHEPCTLLVPEKLAFDPAHVRCQVRPLIAPDVELPKLLPALSLEHPSAGRVLLLYSDWSYLEHRRGGRAVAERWNAVVQEWLPRLSLLFKAGATRVWVNYATLETGDPSLQLYELRRTSPAHDG